MVAKQGVRDHFRYAGEMYLAIGIGALLAIGVMVVVSAELNRRAAIWRGLDPSPIHRGAFVILLKACEKACGITHPSVGQMRVLAEWMLLELSEDDCRKIAYEPHLHLIPAIDRFVAFLKNQTGAAVASDLASASDRSAAP